MRAWLHRALGTLAAAAPAAPAPPAAPRSAALGRTRRPAPRRRAATRPRRARAPAPEAQPGRAQSRRLGADLCWGRSTAIVPALRYSDKHRRRYKCTFRVRSYRGHVLAGCPHLWPRRPKGAIVGVVQLSIYEPALGVPQGHGAAALVIAGSSSAHGDEPGQAEPQKVPKNRASQAALCVL